MPRRHNRRPINHRKYTEPNAIPLRELYVRYNGICQWKMHHISLEEATRDHNLPRSKGGRNGHNFSNIVLMCRSCNSEKNQDIGVKIE